ncbi:MAG: hypothetical protein KDI82_05330 [Gammaproteobacteria bacterium]|nr:hypothetical protein [Gammaproteobacteria bacterium]
MKPAWPGTDAVLDGFERPKLARLRLERFPRGADNYHIDVVLGPGLSSSVSAYVRALVREQVMQLWRQPVQPFSDSIVQVFRRVIVEHHGAAVKRARAEGRPERVQLFELALLKLLLRRVDAELTALRMELEDARSTPASQLSGQSLQLHEQAVVLARQSWHARFLVARRVVRELMQIEHQKLRKVRKSVLGLSWPVPEPLLANPLLQLEGHGDPRDFFTHYPMLLHDTESAARINRLVLGVFSEWLPAAVEVPVPGTPSESLLPGVNRRDQPGSRSLLETERRVRQLFVASELGDLGSSWMDEPDNACALLGGQAEGWPASLGWRQAGISGLQRALNKRLQRELRQAGLLDRVAASYELEAVYPGLGLVDGELLVFEYLHGDVSAGVFKRRLAALDGASDPVQTLRRIDAARKTYRRSAQAGMPQMLARFAGDFLRYRRDLKFAWRALGAMDSIRLLDDEKEIALAAENDAVQVFLCDDGDDSARGTIVGHVIIRIDVRGANEIVMQMRRRNMNPAGHFSRFLYDPITRRLERFGGQKVFVQGDSIVLSMLEQGGEASERLAVARAVCLAADIIEFSRDMNAECERLGLPLIELGIGISYAAESPTYLYDHGRKVAISPALDQALQLSSCHSLLRKACPIPDGQGVCVAVPVHGDKEASGEMVRYNVNGIELDAAGFAQLQEELTLKRVNARDRQSSESEILFIGHCADVRGEDHLLVVRERRVRLWMGRQLLENHDDGRRYYEVLSDPRLLARIGERFASKDEPQGLPRNGRGN